MIDTWKAVVSATFILGLAAYSLGEPQIKTTQRAIQLRTQAQAAVSRAAKPVIYSNTTYRFRITLPASWKGYSIIVGEWHGSVYDEGHDGPTQQEEGPLITIRHPLWTEADRWQDIPIMVFTHAQWKYVDESRIVVSAAPIGPGEIGRNVKYVFALPPRFTVADVNGRDEVGEMLRHQPLHAY